MTVVISLHILTFNYINPFVFRETSMNWDVEVRDDVIEECNKHGGVLHIYVDKASPQGNVYVKCPSIAAAVASVQALHGRWFAGSYLILLAHLAFMPMSLCNHELSIVWRPAFSLLSCIVVIVLCCHHWCHLWPVVLVTCVITET